MGPRGSSRISGSADRIVVLPVGHRPGPNWSRHDWQPGRRSLPRRTPDRRREGVTIGEVVGQDADVHPKVNAASAWPSRRETWAIPTPLCSHRDAAVCRSEWNAAQGAPAVVIAGLSQRWPGAPPVGPNAGLEGTPRAYTPSEPARTEPHPTAFRHFGQLFDRNRCRHGADVTGQRARPGSEEARSRLRDKERAIAGAGTTRPGRWRGS